MPFGTSSRAFGCPGAGGTFAMGDPDEGLGLAYVVGIQPNTSLWPPGMGPLPARP